MNAWMSRRAESGRERSTAEIRPKSPCTSTWWPPSLSPSLLLLELTEIELFQGRACLEPFAQSNHLLAIQIAVPCNENVREA
jgi:hypothetical protein